MTEEIGSSLTKVCTKCGIGKTLDRFSPAKRGLYKCKSYCKDCGNLMSKEYRENDPEKRQAQINASRERNKEKYVEKKKEWHEDHKDELRVRRKIKAKAMTEEQKERKRTRHKEWLKENPEKAQGYKKRRRIRERLGGNTAMEEWIDILLKDPCSYCGGISDTIDHITALENGGRHQVTNVTGCCFSCNSAKKDKSLFVFLAERQLDLELLNSQI